jgi:hypothetical protein
MKIVRIKALNVLNSEVRQFDIEYEKESSLDDIFRIIGEPNAQIRLNDYFGFGYEICNHEKSIPYIVKEEELLWLPKYSVVKVDDFINNFTGESEINIYTGIPQAGGPDLFSIAQLWTMYYPVLDQIGTGITILGGIIAFGKWVKNKVSTSIPPSSYFDFITAKSAWNHFELSKYLNIDDNDAKKLLQGLGYVWNNKTKLYISTHKTYEIRDSLSRISWYKHG